MSVMNQRPEKEVFEEVALLKSIAPSLKSMRDDDRRSKNNSSFAGSSMQEKFRQMIQILETDTKYPDEYDLFVKSVSYAAEGEVPDFEEAVRAVRTLVQLI